jgi:adenylate cyclase
VTTEGTGGRHLRLLPSIRYGTERYPETIARRLRALNITAWIAAPLGASFAATQLLDPAPGMWKPGIVNALAALILMSIPLLHRFGPLAAPLAFSAAAYVAIFFDCFLLGIGIGMQFYYLVITALMILFLGTEHIVLSAALCAVAAVLIIALEIFVPRDTGLQPAAITFASFITTTIASCVILFAIVLYGVREAEREHARSESLLANILPAAIASRLKSRAESVIADRYDEASILFADMAGFTARTSDTAPDDLVQFLNRVFSDFDRVVESHGLEKIKTTGDSYMVVSGVPAPRPDHAQALGQLALDLRDAATGLLDPRGRSVPIRFGISSGPVVAGVVGTRKFFYDVWGDAVNVASRMESTGEPGNIQVSQDTYERLNSEFVLESRGVIDVKGKGEMQTWFLIGRKAPMAAEC